MKSSTNAITFKMFLSLMVLSFIQTALWAQDTTSSSTSSSTNVKISETSETWYSSPWIWIAAAAVFILLLVALTRGGGSNRGTTASTSDTDRVTVTKTVERDTDNV